MPNKLCLTGCNDCIGNFDVPEIVTLIRAIVRGLPRYYTGKPCKNGHLSERITGKRQCVQCLHDRRPSDYKKYDAPRHLLHKYNLTQSDFELLFWSQNGKCACCKIEFNENCKPHVDHNHETKKVRGLLCFRCNVNVSAFDHPLRQTYAAYVDQDGFL